MSAAQEEYNELMRDKARRSRHPEDDHDDDDTRSFLNLSDDDNDRTPSASRGYPDEISSARTSMSQARHTIPRTRYGANTGPKGVISDAQNFRDSKRLHRTSMRSTSSVLIPQMQHSLSLQETRNRRLVSPEEDEEEDEMDDDLDDDFMRHWRDSRLRELQNGKHDSHMHSRERSRRLWGSLVTVDGEGYLDAVDKSPAETVVVVYIYDEYSEVSTEIDQCIKALARKHLDTRFVKLHYADAEMEPAGVPALLAYRGGDKFAGLVPVIQEIPEDADVSATTLESVLRRHQILR